MLKLSKREAAKLLKEPTLSGTLARSVAKEHGERKKNRTEETQAVKAILEWLHAKGIMAWRTNNTAVFDRGHWRKFAGRKGVSDILGVLRNGRFLAIEVKSASGRLRQDQASFIADIKTRGGLAVVSRSIDDVEQALRFEGVI